MAAMNYSGVILASQTEEKNDDEYENDVVDDHDNEEVDELARRRKNSNIMFQPFNDYKEMTPWNFELTNSESVECLAVGSGWCAVYTSYNYIRAFSTEGIQKNLICQSTPLVTMAGYENFLAVVYHTAPAFQQQQALRVKIINMATRDYKILIDADCPISPGSTLTWFGFSEEGQIFTFDSDYVLRSFSYNEQMWTVRLDFRVRYTGMHKLWVVGVVEQEALVIEVPKDHDTPNMIQKGKTMRFKL